MNTKTEPPQIHRNQRCKEVKVLLTRGKTSVTQQPSHAELTTMDLLLKERGWDQSKVCQTRGREAWNTTELMWTSPKGVCSDLIKC